jgi:hypothetical protein
MFVTRHDDVRADHRPELFAQCRNRRMVLGGGRK